MSKSITHADLVARALGALSGDERVRVDAALEHDAVLRRDFEEVLSDCEVLITPTTPETAFRIGEKTSDPLTMYLSDVFTVSANLAGLPGVSVPCGFANQMPVGLQVLGRPLEDATPLRVADALQRRTDFHLQRPPDPR